MRLPLMIVILSFAAVPVSAEPIRLLATGIIDEAWNDRRDTVDFTALIGTRWEFEFTVETATAGVSQWSPTTYRYDDAVSDARFQLGSATYYSAGPTDAFVNAFWPELGSGPAVGFVQYQWWPGVWSEAPPGGFDMNYYAGLFLLSYYDANATAGNLPLFPVFSSVQGGVHAFNWHLQFGLQSGGFRSHEMSLTPVPEPGTLALLGIGLAGSLASRARSRRRRQ